MNPTEAPLRNAAGMSTLEGTYRWVIRWLKVHIKLQHAFAACFGTCYALRDHTLAAFCSGCPSVLIASAKIGGEIGSYSDGRGYVHFPIERE